MLINRCTLLLVAFFLASVSAARQSNPSAQVRDSRISLDVVVTPKSGPPVSGLQQQDFTILDNKVPQRIASFRAVDGAQAPIAVTIVIDAVNADYHTVAYERDQIDRFLRADGGDLDHLTNLAVLTDTGIQVLGDFSKDGNRLSASLDHYAVSLRLWRRSSFYGGADRFQISGEGLQDLIQREAARPGRKILIWVSPGWPLLSGPEVQLDTKEQQIFFRDIVGFSTDLRQNRMTLYSIDPAGANDQIARDTYWEVFVKGISKPGQVSVGNLGLQVLATQSGGVALSFDNDIAALLHRCLSDTRAYYEISFEPPAGNGETEYHHLEVRIARPGLTARTRQGYYSGPESNWQPEFPTPVKSGSEYQ
jgi:VWFA-related protein